MRFKIVGACPCIRTVEEMTRIDKKAADSSFKKYKKEYIDSFMTAQGFCKYKTNAYVRLNKIALLEYVDFQKECYGSKTFTVNLAVMPLYIPHEYIVFGFSKRLGELICGRDIWWDFANEAICAASLANVRDALAQFAMPWFHGMANERHVRLLPLRKKLTSKLSVYDAEWLEKIDGRGDCAEVMWENMEKLALPKSLIQA